MASGDVTVEIADDSPGKGKIKASDVLSLSAKKIKNLINICLTGHHR